MRRYLVIIEQANGDVSAYAPDLPGCVATGRTRADVETNIREAIKFHLDGLAEENISPPEPTTVAEYVTVE